MLMLQLLNLIIRYENAYKTLKLKDRHTEEDLLNYLYLFSTSLILELNA